MTGAGFYSTTTIMCCVVPLRYVPCVVVVYVLVDV